MQNVHTSVGPHLCGAAYVAAVTVMPSYPDQTMRLDVLGGSAAGEKGLKPGVGQDGLHKER
jgi:hypothetical protein